MRLLLVESSSVIGGGGFRPMSLLSRSAIGFVLCCFTFAVTGVVHNNNIDSTLLARFGGAGRVRRSSSRTSNKSPRLRQGGDIHDEQPTTAERSDDAESTADDGPMSVVDAINIVNAVGLQTLSSLVPDKNGKAKIATPAAAEDPPKVVWIMSFGGSVRCRKRNSDSDDALHSFQPGPRSHRYPFDRPFFPKSRERRTRS
jgi:hypothetical protein